jgi:hypothetical protein
MEFLCGHFSFLTPARIRDAILRTIFEVDKQEETGGFRELHNEVHNSWTNTTSVIRTAKTKNMRKKFKNLIEKPSKL